MSKKRQSTEAVAEPGDHLHRMRHVAHDRLDQLFSDAISGRLGRFYGKVAIEITFEANRPMVIHRRIEGSDK